MQQVPDLSIRSVYRRLSARMVWVRHHSDYTVLSRVPLCVCFFLSEVNGTNVTALVETAPKKSVDRLSGGSQKGNEFRLEFV